jgi:PPK2 family polyphosphate:nucleotide phosphotransferase
MMGSMTQSGGTNWSGAVSELLRAGDGFVLSAVDPDSTPGYAADKDAAEQDLAAGAADLDELQERLYAQSRGEASDAAVLLLLQAMDSAGKGGVIRHVVGSVDPQGILLTAFKKPTPDELAHDFLWRVEQRLPQPGFIGVFDRSQYEDVLIGRVRALAAPEEIERRYGAINDFEKRVSDAGTRIVKVMLCISYEEQGERLRERLDRPDKHWKYNPGDIDERVRWPQYMDAYQTVFERTSTPSAPWYVVPANRKWYARLAVQQLLLGALREIDPQWPAATFDVEAEKERLAAT